MVGEKLAACKGLRVRWDDANTLIREAAGESIQWETIVVDHQVEESGKVTVTTEHADGSRAVHTGFDLFVAGERPSRLLSQLNSRFRNPSSERSRRPSPRPILLTAFFSSQAALRHRRR